MKKPANFDLRTAAKNAGVPLWAIADALHISEPTMTRKLRRELGETDKRKILDIISELAQVDRDEGN